MFVANFQLVIWVCRESLWFSYTSKEYSLKWKVLLHIIVPPDIVLTLWDGDKKRELNLQNIAHTSNCQSLDMRSFNYGPLEKREHH